MAEKKQKKLKPAEGIISEESVTDLEKEFFGTEHTRERGPTPEATYKGLAPENPKKVTGPICEKCNEGQLIKESWAEKISANNYRLFDRVICKNCKAVKVEELGKFDKNTDKTRKLIADIKMGRVQADGKRNKKSPVKEEIDVESLFPDEPKQEELL